MPLQILIRIDFYNGIVRFPSHGTAFYQYQPEALVDGRSFKTMDSGVNLMTGTVAA